MTRKDRKQKTEPKEQEKKGLKKAVTNMLELPKEVVLNLPLMSMVGNEEFHIENYKGVIEYSEERIRIHTAVGILKVEGRKLFLKQITTEDMTITGTLLKVEFLI